MSYRNIQVDGQRYRWTAGKTFTKIINKDGQSTLYRNDEWAIPCRSQWISSRNGEVLQGEITAWSVTPRVVRGMIKGQRSWEQYLCERHNVIVTGLCSSPFDAEIHGRITLMGNCYECIDEDAMEI